MNKIVKSRTLRYKQAGEVEEIKNRKSTSMKFTNTSCSLLLDSAPRKEISRSR